MKLTTFIILTLSLLLPSLNAAVTLGISDTSGDPISVSINPGDAFVINVNLTVSVPDDVIGVTFFLQSSGPSISVFSITGRSNIGTVFTDLQTAGSGPISAPGNLLDPSNNSDLGASEPNLTAQGAGNYFISNFTISSLVATPAGNYTLSFVPSTAVYVDGSFGTSSFDSLGSYTVEVIPEPTTMALFAASLTAVMVLRRRRNS
jgi:hypothetical protein